MSVKHAAFVTAQAAYSDYAIRFNWYHQCLMMASMLLAASTTLAPVASAALNLDPGSPEDGALRVCGVLTGTLGTLVMSIMHAAKFYDLSSKCEQLSLLINIYVSGMVKSEEDLARLRQEIVSKVQTTPLMWVPVPSLASDSPAPPGDVPPVAFATGANYKSTRSVV